MIIADAVHDNKIVENVQGLQQRGTGLIQSLQDKLEFLDRTSANSLDECLLLCSDLLNEVEKDILHVATETCSKGAGFSTKSTVSDPIIQLPPCVLFPTEPFHSISISIFCC